METKKTFTRRQLYELVWQRPLLHIARELGISDVALGKACRRHSIPMPGQGYWAKVAAGKTLTKIPLPSTSMRHADSEISFRPAPPRPPKLSAALPVAHQQIHNDEPIVLSTLASPHPLIKQLRRRLDKQKADKYGLRSVEALEGISMSISLATSERALIILDTLLQRLKKAGARVQERQTERNQPARKCLVLDGEELRISVREPYRQQRKSELEAEAERRAGDLWPLKYRYFLSQRLVFSISNCPGSHMATWADGKLQIEEQLPELLKGLLILPELLKENRRQAQEAEKQRMEEQWRQHEIQRQSQRRKQCLNDLVSESERFRQHQDLTRYLDEVQRFAALRSSELTDTFKEAMAAARQLTDELLFIEQRADRFEKHGLVPEQELGWSRLFNR